MDDERLEDYNLDSKVSPACSFVEYLYFKKSMVPHWPKLITLEGLIKN